MRFTKMQGAGNDFVVLDATDPAHPLPPLTSELLRHLGDRRFGVGADQILIVEPPSADGAAAGMDFRYRIFNGASGAEVEHCGNGARCFARYVRDRGLTHRDLIRVETVNSRLALQVQPDGRVRVDMGAPRFEHAQLPFDAAGLMPQSEGGFERWPLALDVPDVGAQTLPVAVLSMGNPHAVARVDEVDTAPVQLIGPLVESHPRFARKVNAGFLQVVSRSRIHLRVYERDAGETLACGTGACAAVVAGVRLGWLDERVDVRTRGGLLTIEWAGRTEGLAAAVYMSGPAETVFEGEITL